MKTAYLSRTLAFTLKAFCCYVLTGSGIYAPRGPRTYYYNIETENDHLVVTELSSCPCLSPDYPAAVNWKLYARRIKPLPPTNPQFSGAVYQEVFSFTELTKPEGHHAVCQQNLCCHLSYKVTEKQKDDIYVMDKPLMGYMFLKEIIICRWSFSIPIWTGKRLQYSSLQPICLCLVFD